MIYKELALEDDLEMMNLQWDDLTDNFTGGVVREAM